MYFLPLWSWFCRRCIPTLVLGRGRLVVRNIGGVIPVPTVVVMVLGSVPAVV